MKKIKISRFLAVATLIASPLGLAAQVVHMSPDQSAALLQRNQDNFTKLPKIVQNNWKKLATTPELTLSAAQVANDMMVKNVTGENGLVFYSVPGISNLQRLPWVYPVDGKLSAPIRIVMAQDEYESGSFEIYPLRDMTLDFVVNPLKNSDGAVIKAGQLDLKVVKVWLQNGNAWYSYFSDTGLVPVPELLLKDETLIKSDFDSKANYAKVKRNGQSEYLWITPSQKIDSSYTEHGWKSYNSFRYMREDFADAATLQPVTFSAGNFKQMWLTVNVLANQAPGVYKGTITIKENGKNIGDIPLEVKVLPFVLPRAKAPDLQRDFLVSLYGGPSVGRFMELNGGDEELAKKQNLAILKNMRAHNLINPMVEQESFERLDNQFDQMREANMDMNTIVGMSWAFPHARTADGDFTPAMYEMGKKDAKEKAEFLKKKLGHTNIYMIMGDEPGAQELTQFGKFIKLYHQEGIKAFCAGHEGMYNRGAYIFDMLPLAQVPELGNSLAKPIAVGNYTGFYAVQHNGSENPDFVRRQHGMAGYKAGHSCIINYEFAFGPWNDLPYDLYKPMTLAYPTREGLVDTLAWEGFREAVDDIRYATKFMQEAERCKESTNLETRYLGRQAMMWWTDQKATEVNLNTLRNEMISYIMKMRDAK